jgi:hypothetical protein
VYPSIRCAHNLLIHGSSLELDDVDCCAIRIPDACCATHDMPLVDATTVKHNFTHP